MIADPSIRSVMHLVAPPSGLHCASSIGRISPTVLCAKAIDARLVPSGRVCIIGDETTADAAAALGLKADLRIAPVFRNPRFMARNLQMQMQRNEHIICWSDELFATSSALCQDTELISTAPHLLRRSPSGHSMIRVIDEIDRDVWEARNRTAILDRDLAALGSQWDAAYERGTLRAQMGIDDQTICLGVVSDCPSDTDARQFAFLLGLFASVGYKLAGILPSSANKTALARRHHAALHRPFRLLFTDDPILTLSPAVDAMINVAHDDSGGTCFVERLCENADLPVIRLPHAEKREMTNIPGAAERVVAQLDEIVRSQGLAGVQT